MLDPSLNLYFDSDLEIDSTYGGSWDLNGGAAATPSTNSQSEFGAHAPLYHDLWATMTGSWAEEI